MKILFSSYAFAPSTGGIETVSALLAEEFVAAGHEVELITETPDDDGPRNYRVTRCPHLTALLRLFRWGDVVFQNNISLRTLIPALLLGKPTLILHQTWIRNTRGQIDWNDRIKLSLLDRVTNVSISAAVAESIGDRGEVIPNPYRDDLFQEQPNAPRDKTLVFLGRLVSDKGVDLLLQALARLQNDGLTPDLTVIGDGPESATLRQLARDLGLSGQVTFAGGKSGIALVEALNQHRIMVIPSRWAEPFGIVALEGIACGCAIVGSADGGMPEAIGPCGLIFPNGEVEQLAAALRRILTEPDLIASLRAAAPEHLARFQSRVVARQHLDLLQKIAS